MQDTKRLYKSTSDKMIFGVAGGLADYFEVDPVLVRLVLVLLAVGSAGTMVLVYIIAAIIMPTAATAQGQRQTFSERVEELGHEASEVGQRAGAAARSFASDGTTDEVRERRRKLAGLILLALGAIFLAANFGWWWFSWATWWPAALIIAGVLIIAGRSRGARK